MSNAVNVGSVRLFDTLCQDKAQAVKVLEEAAEVFGAWQELREINFDTRPSDYYKAYAQMVDECADVIQATCNLVAAYEVNGCLDFELAMKRCEWRNLARGRITGEDE